MCFFFHPRVERLKGEMKPNVNAALFALEIFSLLQHLYLFCTCTNSYWAHSQTSILAQQII